MSDQKLRILGLDPGIKNFAASIQEIQFIGMHEQGRKIRSHEIDIQIIKTGLLKNPMYDVNTGVVEQNRRFVGEMRGILRKYKPDIVCAERFQNRGFRAGGGQMEAVNLMLGALASMEEFDNIQLKLVSPMVWKSAVKKQFDLKEAYKRCRFPVHEWDATLIGLYGAYIITEQTPFSCYELSVEENVDNIMQQVEQVTMSQLKNKRIPKNVKKR